MVSLFFTLALFSSGFAAVPLPLKITIDPGHGGQDRGAIVDNIQESEIALKISRLIRDRLQRDPKFQVTMTRDKDQFLTLDQRVEKAHQAGADLFLSLHLNSSPDQRAKGVEFYFQNQLPADEEANQFAELENLKQETESEIRKKLTDVELIVEDLKNSHRLRESLKLSKALAKEWQKEEKTRASSVRQAPFRVVSKTRMASCLIELGFLTNKRDAQKLTQTADQVEMAAKIHRGLEVYYESWLTSRAKAGFSNSSDGQAVNRNLE